MYDSIHAEVNCEVVAHQRLYWDDQHCVETYLTDVLTWSGEQGRAVLIIQRHSIRFIPSMINAEYPNMKIVFLSDTSITSSPLQLGTICDVHVLYQNVDVHNVMEQNAAISS